MAIYESHPIEVTVTEISKKANVTFAYASSFVSELQRLGVIDTTLRGRCKYCRLTKKGKQFLIHLIKTKVILYGRFEFG